MAQVMPTDSNAPLSVKKPFTPTMALSLSSASVVAGSLEIDLFLLNLAGDIRRDRVLIDLQADLQGRLGTEPRAYAAELLAGNCMVKLQLIAPKSFVAKCVEAKDLPTLVDHAQGVALGLLQSRIVATRINPSSLSIRRLGQSKRVQSDSTGDYTRRCNYPDRFHGLAPWI